MNNIPDREIENRLRATMSDAAARVGHERVAGALPVTALMDHAAGLRPDTRPSRGRAAAPLLAAAVVVVLAGTVTIVAESRDGKPGPSHDASPARPQPAAAAAQNSGGYTYVQVSGATETLQTWIPADRADTWQFTNSNMPAASRTDRGRCAAFPHYLDANGVVASCDGGSWTTFRPKFDAALPNDWKAVLGSLRRADPPPTDAGAFSTAFNYLSAGWSQPTSVAKIVAALKQLREVRVSRRSDGRTTLSFSGRLKATVVERWSITVDQNHRIVATTFSYGHTTPLRETLTYTHVAHLGDTTH